MNLILLSPENKLESDRYALTARQQTHVSKVIKAKSGDQLKVGIINGKIGKGIYEPPNDTGVGYIHSLSLQYSAPPSLPIILVMALPRPNMLKRTLQNVATMGVKEIYLIHSAKVEKSYWQSPVLQTDSVKEYLLQGLEQARDTVMPRCSFIPRFRPFVEDQLPHLLKDKVGLLAHPYLAKSCPIDIKKPCVLALGPEGGWNEFEVEKWLEAGMESVHLGERILKVETVVPVLLSRLFPA